MTKKSPNSDWQYKKTKSKRNTVVRKDYNNATVWQIDNLDKLIIEMDKSIKEVLAIILDRQKIYTEYLN